MEAIPQMTWLFSNISSEGNREMNISLEDIKLGVEVSLGLGSWCDDGGVEVTSIRFPLHYKNIEFEFDNIGSVLGAALDIIGDVVVNNENYFQGTTESSKKQKLFLMSWCPDSAKIKKKMLYASSFETLKKSLVSSIIC